MVSLLRSLGSSTSSFSEWGIYMYRSFKFIFQSIWIFRWTAACIGTTTAPTWEKNRAVAIVFLTSFDSLHRVNHCESDRRQRTVNRCSTDLTFSLSARLALVRPALFCGWITLCFDSRWIGCLLGSHATAVFQSDNHLGRCTNDLQRGIKRLWEKDQHARQYLTVDLVNYSNGGSIFS